MKKRMYRSISVKSVVVEQLVEAAGGALVLGCDAAKEVWLGAFMNRDREVVSTVRWPSVSGAVDVVRLLLKLREAGVKVEVAIEATGTYADAFCELMARNSVEVYAIRPKDTHDYQEIYDGVPSGHDAKSAAIVAKLHWDKPLHQRRRWQRPDGERREVRAMTDRLDWLRQEENRWLSRLESRLARHWPEVWELMDMTGATPIALLAEYGGPAEVVKAGQSAAEKMSTRSRGLLSKEKIAAVVESARQTLGVAMTRAELEQVRWLAQQITRTREEATAIERQLKRRIKQAPSINAVGEVVGLMTAAVLSATLGDFSKYESVRALQRAAGINLKERSSGKYKGQLKITKRGSSTARRWLFLATLRWIKDDALARAWFQRKVERNGGVKLKAVVALMRKLLAGLYHTAHGATFDSSRLFDVRRLKRGHLKVA
jgi:transposase